MGWKKRRPWEQRDDRERTEAGVLLSEKIPVTRVLDVPYFDGGMDEALALALARTKGRTPYAVFTPGATLAARALKDPAFAALLREGDLILPDGCGCLLAARLCGTRLRERVAGIDFAERLLREAEAFSARVFLYGGRMGVAERAAASLRKKYPSLIFAAAHGYGEDPWERISAFRPHIVCVCLGAERQEGWILKHKEQVGGVFLGLGGSLDVWAGDVCRAPSLLRRTGLEWAYRTLREPRRIVRLFPLPRYFLHCLLSRRWAKCKKKEEKKKSDVKL